jgi:hypothetical protein
MSRFETTEATGFYANNRFIDDGAGITINYENRIVKLVKQIEPDNGVEFLVGALASVCNNDQMAAFAMHLEERAAK